MCHIPRRGGGFRLLKGRQLIWTLTKLQRLWGNNQPNQEAPPRVTLSALGYFSQQRPYLELPEPVKTSALGGEWGCLTFLWKRQRATDPRSSLVPANPTGTLTPTVGVPLWNGEDSAQPDRPTRLSTQRV